MAKNNTGFIIDAPNALIMTSKNDYDVITASSGEVNFGSESISINGGWSFYDLIEIDTKSSIEVSLTEAQWKMQHMEATTGGELKTGEAEQYYFGTPYTVTSDKATIPYAVVPKSLRINGFKEVDVTPAKTGEFQVTISGDKADLTFFTGDLEDGVEITPSFRVKVANSEILSVKTTDSATSGVVILQFPVYGDEKGVGVEGYMQITIFKGKLSKDNKIGGSYKSASTFDMKIKGLDPRRPDKKMFEMAYIPIVE